MVLQTHEVETSMPYVDYNSDSLIIKKHKCIINIPILAIRMGIFYTFARPKDRG